MVFFFFAAPHVFPSCFRNAVVFDMEQKHLFTVLDVNPDSSVSFLYLLQCFDGIVYCVP